MHVLMYVLMYVCMYVCMYRVGLRNVFNARKRRGADGTRTRHHHIQRVGGRPNLPLILGKHYRVTYSCYSDT